MIAETTGEEVLVQQASALIVGKQVTGKDDSFDEGWNVDGDEWREMKTHRQGLKFACVSEIPTVSENSS